MTFGLAFGFPRYDVKVGVAPPPSGFIVLASDNTPYTVTQTVLDSAGASYTVSSTVLSSNGTAYVV